MGGAAAAGGGRGADLDAAGDARRADGWCPFAADGDTNVAWEAEDDADIMDACRVRGAGTAWGDAIDACRANGAGKAWEEEGVPA